MIKLTHRPMSLAARFGSIFYTTTFIMLITLALALFSFFRIDVEKSLLSSVDLTVNGNLQTIDDLITRLELYKNLIIENEDVYLNPLLEINEDPLSNYKTYVRMIDQTKRSLSITCGSIVRDCKSYILIDHSMPFSELIAPMALRHFQQPPVEVAVHITRPDYVKNTIWYQTALEYPDTDYWFTQPETPNVINVISSLRTKAVVNDRLVSYNIGHSLVSFSASWLEDSMIRNETGNELMTYLLNPQGFVLYSSDSAMNGIQLNPLIVPSNSSPDLVFFQGEQCYIWRNETHCGLFVVTLLPRREITSLMMHSMKIVLIIAVVLLLVGLFLIFTISRYATEPIRRLADHMRSQTLEPLSEAAGARSHSSEVQHLYSSFNNQILRITSLISEVRRKEQEKTQTELQLLQAQINPHFICNALDTVCCRALMRGDDDVAEILSDLADIMRYSFKNPSQKIPLAKELGIVEQYLKIQQTCIADQIILCREIDANCLDCIVPKMILQPLVENAVRHTDDYRSLHLKVICENEYLLIRMSNHSKNISAAQLNAHISGQITLSSHSTGISIRNIDQRLRLIYGDSFRLIFHQISDSNIVAELRIPLEYEQVS